MIAIQYMNIYHPIVEEITNLLTRSGVWFETFVHPPVLTSEEAAQVRPGYTLNQGAKALIVKIEDSEKINTFCMLVLPAHLRLDSKRAKKMLNTKNLRFATENEIDTVTSGVKRGAIPPFGNLFKIKVYADPQLFENEKMVFNAGDRSFSVAMNTADFKIIVQPQVIEIVQ